MPDPSVGGGVPRSYDRAASGSEPPCAAKGFDPFELGLFGALGHGMHLAPCGACIACSPSLSFLALRPDDSIGITGGLGRRCASHRHAACTDRARRRVVGACPEVHKLKLAGVDLRIRGTLCWNRVRQLVTSFPASAASTVASNRASRGASALERASGAS